MIATVLIDVQSVFPIGVLVALAAYRQIRVEKPGPLSRYVRAGALFGLLWGAAVGIMCWHYPDWMWAYALPIHEWPFAWWYAGFVVAMVLACAAGALVAQAFIAAGQLRWAVASGVAVLFVLAVVWSITWQQYTHLSTYADWHASPRVATSIFEDQAFQARVNLVGAVQVIVGLTLAVRFFAQGRKLKQS